MHVPTQIWINPTFLVQFVILIPDLPRLGEGVFLGLLAAFADFGGSGREESYFSLELPVTIL